MRIKKHRNHNQYLLTEDNIWIRDVTAKNKPAIDINNLISKSEYASLIDNEITNFKSRKMNIEDQEINFKKLAIISDGYQFEEKQSILESLPKDVVIIAVNGALKKWNLIGKRRINLYLVNNPFKESLSFLPKHKYFPKCIASNRTFPEFIEKYKGDVAFYSPTPNEHYCGYRNDSTYFVDDYRSSICAALNLSRRFSVEKILIFCCDDVFKEERNGSVKIDDLWCYPQQLMAQRTIDGCLFWLGKEAKIAHHSKAKFKNAAYIEASEVTEFFKDTDND